MAISSPSPAVFWWLHCRCSHFNRFVGYFQPLLVVAPSIPAFLEFGLVCSCSHRKAPSTLSMFWWTYCRCLRFCNLSLGLAVPFGLLHSLGLGWACRCPHGYGTSIPPIVWWVCLRNFLFQHFITGGVAFLGVAPSILAFLDSGWVSACFTGMQHLFLWCLGGFIVDSPMSAFFERLAAPFRGCAIYSCIFGFWLGLQIFPWQYSTYSRGVLVIHCTVDAMWAKHSEPSSISPCFLRGESAWL